MTRRYTEVEQKLVAELVPGDEVLSRRRAVSITRSAVQAVVTWDDGSSQTFDLAGDPALEVVAKQASTT